MSSLLYTIPVRSHSTGNIGRGLSILLYHGTCGRCHHLHTAQPIDCTSWIRSGPHQRIKCAKCKHHLFGIGSNSTQTTLASALTSSSWENEMDSTEETAVACTNSRCSERSPSHAKSDEATTSTTAPATHSPQQIECQDQERVPENAPITRSRDQRAAFFNRPRSWLSPRSAPNKTADGATVRPWKLSKKISRLFSGFRRPGTARNFTQSQTSLDGDQMNPLSTTRDVGVMTENPVAGPFGDSPSTGREATMQNAIRPSATQDTTVAFVSESRSSKRQRIYNTRYEKTIRRRALRRRKCYCSRNCPCAKRDPIEVNHASPIESNQPQPPLENRSASPTDTESEILSSTPCPIRERIDRVTQFFGEHFPDIPYRVSTGRESSILLEYPRSSRESSSTSAGLSQATTAIDSRSSGAHRDRLLLRRRSNRSPALLPDVRFSEQERPDVLPAIRRVDELLGLSARRSTDQTDASNLSGSSNRQSPRRSSGESIGANVRATTANLARLNTTQGESNIRWGGIFEPGRPTPITEEPTPIVQATGDVVLRAPNWEGGSNQVDTTSRAEPDSQPSRQVDTVPRAEPNGEAVDMEEVNRRLSEQSRAAR